MAGSLSDDGVSSPKSGDEDTVVVESADSSLSEGLPAGQRLTPGTHLGRYRIEAVLGEGGMGSVYRAHDPSLDRHVALKLLRASVRASDQERARLLREGQAVAALSHPNIVQVYDGGESEQGVFLAMELLDGQDLGKWRKTPQPAAEVLSVYLQAARGLAAAHDAGLVHRDFKPANVMLTSDGRVVVLDFGLVQAEGATPTGAVASLSSLDSFEPDHNGSGMLHSDDRLTRTGTVVGTPAYMPPEQRMGQDVDGRSDQYAFCVSMYEAFAGQRPFEYGVFRTRSSGPKPRPALEDREVPAWIVPILLRGMSSRRSERWPSMHHLIAALQRRRSSRWWVAGVAGAALTAVVVATRAGDPDAAAASACDAQERLDEAWSAARANDVRTSMEASGLAYHASASRHAVEVLDGWADQWLEARQAWCASQGEPVRQELTRGCLNAQLDRLVLTLETLTAGDEASVNRAPSLVSLLDAPSKCAEGDVSALGDTDVLRRVQAIEVALDRADTLRSAGRKDESVALTEETLAEAEALGHLGSLALAKSAMGIIATERTEFDRAFELYEAAHGDAVAASREDVAAEVAVRLAELHMKVRTDRAAADRWFRHAEAGLERRPDDRILAHLLGVRANALSLDDAPEALELLDEQRVVFEKLGDELGLIHNELNRANKFSNMGRYEDALKLTQASLPKMEALRGPEHPEVARVLVNLGTYHLETNDVENGRAALERGLKILVAAGDRQSEVVVRHNLALHLRNAKEFDAARRHFELSYATSLELFGNDHPLTATIESSRGTTAVFEGDLDEAERWYVRSLETRTRLHGDDSHEVGRLLLNLGNLERDRGRYEASVKYLDRLVEIGAGREGLWLELYGDALFVRAKTKVAMGRLEEAVAEFERVAEYARRIEEPPASLANILFELGRLKWKTGRRADARHDVDEATVLIDGEDIPLARSIAKWKTERSASR